MGTKVCLRGAAMSPTFFEVCNGLDLDDTD